MNKKSGVLDDIFRDAGLDDSGHPITDSNDIKYDQNDSDSQTDRNGKKRANDLDGKTWTKHSISIWSDIRKSSEELSLNHPAMFPAMLPSRLIEMFTHKGDTVVDPFAGVGTTLIAAKSLGRNAVGIELSGDFHAIAANRIIQSGLFDGSDGEATLFCDDANNLDEHIKPHSVDLVVTSPPYWDILTEKRTADYKEIRNYGDNKGDLGRIPRYEQFIKALQSIFGKLYITLKDGAYCCIVVMDIRKKSKFYPFHSDLASSLCQIGYELDDIIIWDRRQEYNNLRPLGYPAVFRVNKVHEFIVILRKPSIGR